MLFVKARYASLSIKNKLTIFISISIFILIFISLTFLIIAGKGHNESEIKNTLIQTVENNAHKILLKNNQIFLDKEVIFLNNIYTAIYNEKGNFIYGETPKNFPLYQDFKTNTVKKINQFYVYDKKITIKNTSIFIRGIVSYARTKKTFSSLFYITIILLPILAILTTILAKIFINNTFHPIEHILHVAQQIQNSKDLTLRINLQKNNNDEIHALAHTFDSMFESLEKSFIKEKQFTSDVSHELKTPTSVIIAQCELALENTKDQETKEALQTILWNAKKMSQITSQLLLLSKAEHFNEVLEKEEINFSELCEIIAEQQQEIALEKNITLQFNIEPNITIFGDSALITSAILNLFSNAIKYNKKNGKIFFSLTQNKTEIFGRISDTGIGISEHDLPKIWERFYQVDQSRARNHQQYHGTGLGLPLVKWIIQAHKGNITAQSSINKGSIFSFTLPKKNN